MWSEATDERPTRLFGSCAVAILVTVPIPLVLFADAMPSGRPGGCACLSISQSVGISSGLAGR